MYLIAPHSIDISKPYITVITEVCMSGKKYSD
jgi:hypothetical protein